MRAERGNPGSRSGRSPNETGRVREGGQVFPELPGFTAVTLELQPLRLRWMTDQVVDQRRIPGSAHAPVTSEDGTT